MTESFVESRGLNVGSAAGELSGSTPKYYCIENIFRQNILLKNVPKAPFQKREDREHCILLLKSEINIINSAEDIAEDEWNKKKRRIDYQCQCILNDLTFNTQRAISQKSEELKIAVESIQATEYKSVVPSLPKSPLIPYDIQRFWGRAYKIVTGPIFCATATIRQLSLSKADGGIDLFHSQWWQSIQDHNPHFQSEWSWLTKYGKYISLGVEIALFSFMLIATMISVFKKKNTDKKNASRIDQIKAKLYENGRVLACIYFPLIITLIVVQQTLLSTAFLNAYGNLVHHQFNFLLKNHTYIALGIKVFTKILFCIIVSAEITRKIKREKTLLRQLKRQSQKTNQENNTLEKSFYTEHELQSIYNKLGGDRPDWKSFIPGEQQNLKASINKKVNARFIKIRNACMKVGFVGILITSAIIANHHEISSAVPWLVPLLNITYAICHIAYECYRVYDKREKAARMFKSGGDKLLSLFKNDLTKEHVSPAAITLTRSIMEAVPVAEKVPLPIEFTAKTPIKPAEQNISNDPLTTPPSSPTRGINTQDETPDRPPKLISTVTTPNSIIFPETNRRLSFGNGPFLPPTLIRTPITKNNVFPETSSHQTIEYSQL